MTRNFKSLRVNVNANDMPASNKTRITTKAMKISKNSYADKPPKSFVLVHCKRDAKKQTKIAVVPKKFEHDEDMNMKRVELHSLRAQDCSRSA